MSDRINGPVRSAFEVASQNLRSTLRYLRYQLEMPPETIRMQVDGILTSFAVEEAYERTRIHPKSEGP